MPDNQAKFLGLKVYRNADTGLFLHITHNIDILDSFFFNNQIGIDIDRANNIRISSSRISAIDEYLNISMTEDEILKKKQRACKNQVVGIELHSWKDDTNNVGVTVENVAFSGFDHNCGNSVPISIDETVSVLF